MIGRYEPPSARVADLEPPAVRVPRPRYVTIALVVLWMFLAMNALGVAARLGAMPAFGSLDGWSISYIAYVLVLLIVPAFLLVNTAQGRDWARMAAATFYGMDLVFRFYLTQFDRTPAWMFIGIISVVYVTAMAVLFLPASNAWFRSKRVIA